MVLKLRNGHRTLARLCAIVFLFTLFAVPAHGQTTRGPEPGTLTLGIVADVNQQAIENHFRDFVRYLAGKISPERKLEGTVVVARSPAHLADLLKQKRVDFYIDSPYATYIINNVHGAGMLLLRRWKGGASEYQSLIFARKGGETTRLEDLRGKIIAFEDPGSTSGHFLPKFFLSRMGFKLVEKSGTESQVAAAEIGYVFAHSQEKLVELVLSKKAAAGAFSTDDYAALEAKKKSEIAILGETERLPRSLLSVRADMPPALVGRLEQILSAMHEDAEGRLVLEKTGDTTKFDALPGGEEAMRRRLLETFFSPDKP